MDQSYIEDSETLVPKKRIFFGMEFAPRDIPLSRRLETLAVIIYVSIFVFIGVLSIPIMAYLLFYTEYYLYVVAYIAWYLYDFQSSETGGRRWEFFSNSPLWYAFRDYFPIKLIKTSDLNPSDNYIFGYHPHGIMSFGAACFSSGAMNFKLKFPGITPHVLVLRGWFRLPITREIFSFMGACSVTKESIHYVLSKMGPGASVVLPIGGAAEVLESHPGRVSLKLKNRKGFVRRAYIEGAKLVPVFAFGENEVYEQVDNPEGSFLRILQNNLKKLLGFYPAFIYGRGVFQYTYGLLPHRKPITVVVGNPISVDKWPNPGIQEVDTTHALYLKELKELFDKFKGTYGMKDTEIEFT